MRLLDVREALRHPSVAFAPLGFHRADTWGLGARSIPGLRSQRLAFARGYVGLALPGARCPLQGLHRARLTDDASSTLCRSATRQPRGGTSSPESLCPLQGLHRARLADDASSPLRRSATRQLRGGTSIPGSLRPPPGLAPCLGSPTTHHSHVSGRSFITSHRVSCARKEGLERVDGGRTSLSDDSLDRRLCTEGAPERGRNSVSPRRRERLLRDRSRGIEARPNPSLHPTESRAERR